MSSTHEQIKVLRDLKPLIRSDIAAAYGPKSPKLHMWTRFDITTMSRTDMSHGKRHSYFTAQAIAINAVTDDVVHRWTLLQVGDESDTMVGAYYNLWTRVQEDVRKIMGESH